MVGPVASFVVSLGTDGRIAHQGTVEEILATDKEMQAEAKKSAEAMEKAKKEEESDSQKVDDETKKSDGKLVIAEEIAMGHVSWLAGRWS